jgi:hypothetical protein
MKEKVFQKRLEQLAKAKSEAFARYAIDIANNPRLAEALSAQFDALEQALEMHEAGAADGGLSELIGIGADTARELGDARIPVAVKQYDETITSERIVAMADLYYIYQHEKIGVFKVIDKLKQLYEAGAVRISNGDGAFGLYRYDRRAVLRFTTKDRLAGYCRAFGYCAAPPPSGARPNREFHHLFSHFITEVAIFWRDKRISEVMRERANDPTFGSIATVRRGGLDLRNNLKFVSYGHINAMRVELLRLLEEAFAILGASDIQKLFGAETAWDVVEEVLTRYFNESPDTSTRQRMAVSGREILRWLAHPHILQSGRTQFESLLVEIAEFAEEWLTSAESLGIAEPRSAGRILSFEPKVVRGGQSG